MWRHLCLALTARALAPPKVVLGDYLVQRAVQQQLNYMADLKNEPLGNWLKSFQSHEHLDSNNRRAGAGGFPGTYSAAFNQFNMPYKEYLEALGTGEKSVVEVLTPARRRLSAREKANPFLAPPKMEVSEQLIDPQNVLIRLVTTAGAMVGTWDFQFEGLAESDLERVEMENMIPGLPDAQMLLDGELAKGGETRTSWYTNDEPMPLFAFDQRACDRLCTLRALSALIKEIEALTPQDAFDCDYLRREAKEDDEGEIGESADAVLVARLLEKRAKRREEREAKYVKGEEAEKAVYAKEAALAFLEEFGARWVPKLVKGDNRSSLQKRSKRPPPGQYESRGTDAGTDADDVLEALWNFRQDSPNHIRGGELVIPGRMVLRLRELRAVEAESCRRELKEIHPELLGARAKYTNYGDDFVTGNVPGESAGDEGWD